MLKVHIVPVAPLELAITPLSGKIVDMNPTLFVLTPVNEVWKVEPFSRGNLPLVPGSKKVTE